VPEKPTSMLLTGFVLLVSSCSPGTGPGPTGQAQTEAPVTLAHAPTTLTVFAAASLAEAFGDIGRQFETVNPEVTVVFNFGASNQLAQQLGQGAPGDVFASANQAQMDIVIEAGRVLGGAEQTFVKNRLVVIFPEDNPGGVSALQDLRSPGLRLVLAAREVPVGQYSLDFLDKASQDAAFGTAFKDDVLKTVASSEESVRAVLAKVSLGEADAGIVYTSDVSGESAALVGRLDIPENLNTIASYPIAPIRDSANFPLAQAFVDFVLSRSGQDTLTRYGFIPVK